MLKKSVIKKLETISMLQVNVENSIGCLRFNVPTEIHVVFHNTSNDDYHFIIKVLAKEFEGQFEFLMGKHRKEEKFFCFDIKRSYKS